jgi:hypothetical protein
MMTREMPQTRRAGLYRKILGAVWVVAISSITLTLARMASELMDVGLDPVHLDAKKTIINVLLLIGAGLMGWIGWRGSRRNLMPPAWGMVTLVAIVWAALLFNRLA